MTWIFLSEEDMRLKPGNDLESGRLCFLSELKLALIFLGSCSQK